MLKPIMTPIMKAIMSTYFGQMIAKRWAYNFDGVDDRGQFALKAINPDGDIDIEWEHQGYTPRVGLQVIIGQSISLTNASKEFNLLILGTGSGAPQRLEIGIGGNLSIPAPTYSDGKWRITYIGTTVTLFKNGVQVNQLTGRTRGSGREPAATTKFGVRENGVGIFDGWVTGRIFNLKINGVLYPVADRNQSIQLPLPTGLGVELITPFVNQNPTSKGSQWTDLGGGRWRLIGDGSYNGLQFIQLANLPDAMYVEFEVESISGGTLRISTNTSIVGERQFNTVGIKRLYFTTKPTDFIFVRNGSDAVSCVIKNISFKPLWSVTGSELVANGTFNTDISGWTVLGNATTSVSNGRVSIGYVAGQNSRLERGVLLENGSYYLVSADLVSTTGPSARLFVLRGAAGSFADILRVDSNVVGRMQGVFLANATDAIISLRTSDGTANPTIVWDNVSILKLGTICNPLTLTNTTPDRWEEIEGTLPKTRLGYNFDGIDDRGELAFKAVNMDGDNTFEFWTPTGIGAADQQIITQNINSGGAGSEFRISYTDTGSFKQVGVTYGGTTTVIVTDAQGLKAGTKYGLTLIGTQATVYEGGLQGTFVRSVTFTKGAIREPLATTTIMVRRAGTLTSYVQWASGIQRDIRINGVLWKMDAVGNSIQESTPPGNPLTLVNTTPDRWIEVLE